MKVAIIDNNKEMGSLIQYCVVVNKEIEIKECDIFTDPFELLQKMEDGKKYHMS